MEIVKTALQALQNSIIAAPDGSPMLIEGQDYYGCWLESTGTVSAETLALFDPVSAQSTVLLFAKYIREDGLIPYKITPFGPAYRQVQMVTPLARTVWNIYRITRDKSFLRTMYDAMSRNDEWIAKYRNTRGTGCVEAFCTYDTGHDRSPRFLNIPDTCLDDDPTRYFTAVARLPYLAPDMTANVYCQRKYLAIIAEELGLSGAQWRKKADLSRLALFEYCYDKHDGCFYDLDATGSFVKIKSDVLLRVLCCETADDTFVKNTFDRYIFNESEFLAPYGILSISKSEPGFSPYIVYNNWAGPPNILAQLRLYSAFRNNPAFTDYLKPLALKIIGAISAFGEFPQLYDGFTGRCGFGTGYTPAMLLLLLLAQTYM